MSGLGRAGGGRGMVKGQAGWAGGTHRSPSCPPHTSFISPLRAHLHPQCGLAGCGVGVLAALAARWWAAGAVPSLPVPAHTGPVPCCDPALCCCLHGPQLSKPRCQTPGLCPFCREQGLGGGLLAQAGLQTELGQQVYSQLRAQGSIPSQAGMAGPQGLAGMQGWPGGAECPPYPLCPGQPCPAGRSEMGGFLLATSQCCPHHSPSSQGPWLPRLPSAGRGVGEPSQPAIGTEDAP